MKGKATIIISDAVTGEELSRREEHNIVTDAVQNIFSLPHYMLLHEFNYSKLFTTGFPLWNDLLSGVVLLGNSRNEDPSDFMLGTDTVPVGHAGGEYAGANTMRGSMNLNESGQLENGYRFVWDFASDKANGTIKCIGLTSREFGNAGFQSGTEKDGAFYVLPQNIGDTNDGLEGAFVHGAGQYIGTFQPLVHLFAELNADNDLVFRRYRANDPTALGMGEEFGVRYAWTPISETVVTPSFNVRYDNRFFLNTDTRTVYFFNGPKNVDGFTLVCYVGVSVDDLTIVDSGAINVPYVSFECCAVYKDHIWLDTSDVLQEYDRSGSLIAEHECSGTSASTLFMVNGCLMQKAGETIRCYSWGDDACVIANEHLHHLPLPNCDAKPPYMAAAMRNTHSAGNVSVYSKPVPVIISSYLATINNLATPLEKTSAQTLKIIYDITEN